MSSVYPRLIADDIYMCGFTSPKSYGGMSYFIHHPDGNWLVDSPRFEPHLEEKFESMGGVRYIFLTHRDDVADSNLYARRFGARRIIHEQDSNAAPGAEILIKGIEPFKSAPEFTIIPVPGHTRGHCVLHYKGKYLFTGDHLEFDPVKNQLGAYRDYCWYNWEEQTKSMERLLAYSFEWVLPGHGHRVEWPADKMKQELQALVGRMKE